jgi:hypothetical protein
MDTGARHRRIPLQRRALEARNGRTAGPWSDQRARFARRRPRPPSWPRQRTYDGASRPSPPNARYEGPSTGTGLRRSRQKSVRARVLLAFGRLPVRPFGRFPCQLAPFRLTRKPDGPLGYRRPAFDRQGGTREIGIDPPPFRSYHPVPCAPRNRRRRRELRRRRRELRHLRERPGTAAGPVSRWQQAVRGRYTRRSARDLQRDRLRSDAHRLGSRRHGAGGGGGPIRDRGLGREQPVGQRQHRRRVRQPAACGAYAARRRRAARHRLRRPWRQPRLHHHRAPRPAADGSVARERPGSRRSAAHHARGRPRRRLGSTPTRSAPDSVACPSASSRSSATRRAPWP